MHFSDQVSIGSITLTRSALIMLIAGLILSLVIALTVPFGIFIGLFVFLGVCVGAYNVNCAVVGKCYNWAANIDL